MDETRLKRDAVAPDLILNFSWEAGKECELSSLVCNNWVNGLRWLQTVISPFSVECSLSDQPTCPVIALICLNSSLVFVFALVLALLFSLVFALVFVGTAKSTAEELAEAGEVTSALGSLCLCQLLLG